MLPDALDVDASTDNSADSGNSRLQLLLVFHLLIHLFSSDLVSKDNTFNTRQEKEPLVVDPLGLFKVLPHSPAKKVVCSIIIVIIT